MRPFRMHLLCFVCFGFCFYCLCSFIFVEKYESNLRLKHHLHDEYQKFVSLIGRYLLFEESGSDELANAIYLLLHGAYRIFMKELKYKSNYSLSYKESKKKLSKYHNKFRDEVCKYLNKITARQ